MTSGLAGTGPTFTFNNECGDAYPGWGPGFGGGIQPYNGTDFIGRMGILRTPKSR